MAEQLHIRMDSGEETFQRWDLSHISSTKIQTTPQGFLKVPATLTKAGVFEYRTDRGVVRELRPEDEVLKADSLATLPGAVVTIGHMAMVNPDNVQSVSSGYVAEEITKSNLKANGHLVIQRSDAIDRVQKKKLVDLSPGYTCRIDRTPGVWKGQPYDQVQRKIKYNHIALLEPGEGRQGDEVSIKLDSKKGFQEKNSLTTQGSDTMEEITIRIDGRTFSVQVAKGAGQIVTDELARVEKERNDARDDLAKAEGKAAAEKARADKAEKELAEATDPAAIQKRVDAMSKVTSKAQKIAPDADFSGMSLQQVKETALEAAGVDRETFDGKGESFVDGMFEALKAPKADSKPAPKVVGLPTPQPRTDKKEDKKQDRYDSVAAYERMKQRSEALWKTHGRKAGGE